MTPRKAAEWSVYTSEMQELGDGEMKLSDQGLWESARICVGVYERAWFVLAVWTERSCLQTSLIAEGPRGTALLLRFPEVTNACITLDDKLNRDTLLQQANLYGRQRTPIVDAKVIQHKQLHCALRVVTRSSRSEHKAKLSGSGRSSGEISIGLRRDRGEEASCGLRFNLKPLSLGVASNGPEWQGT